MFWHFCDYQAIKTIRKLLLLLGGILYCCYCGSSLRGSSLQDRARSKRESVRVRVRVPVRYGCLLLLLRMRMRGSVLLRYSSGIGACAVSVQYGCLLLLLRFVGTWIGACVGSGPVQFVVVVLVVVVLVVVVAGTVGMGIRACAGYGMVRLFATATVGRWYVDRCCCCC